MKRDQDELINILKEQIGFLETSCSAFDSGNESEAKRIAIIIRVLVHDTDKSTSLLAQLGYKNKLKFLDSSLPIDPQLVDPKKREYVCHGLPGLVGIKVASMQAKFIAPFSRRPGAKGSVSFSEWWEKKCIPGDDERRYSRKELVLWMANKEGGAHVDKDIDTAYRKLSSSSLGMSFSVGGVNKGFSNSSADASVRQIGWEILETLKKHQRL